MHIAHTYTYVINCNTLKWGFYHVHQDEHKQFNVERA